MTGQAPDRFEAVLKAAIDAARPLEAILPKSAEDSGTGEISTPPADDGEERKPSLADQMVRLAREAATLFVAPDDTTYAAVETRGHREVWAIRSRAFRAWMIHRFFKTTGRAPSEDVLSQARLTLDAIAIYQGEKRPVFIRTASHDGRLYLDLCDADWRALEIDA